MRGTTVDSELESELLHTFKNQLGIALGFVDLLIDEADTGDPRVSDLQQVQRAVQQAMDMLPELARQLKK